MRIGTLRTAMIGGSLILLAGCSGGSPGATPQVPLPTIQRQSGAGSDVVRTRCRLDSLWPQFHDKNMKRWNRCEKTLNVGNVGNLKLKWKYLTGGNIIDSPAVVKGAVYIGSSDDNVYALNAKTGAMLWSYNTGDLGYSSPAVSNGMVYIASFSDNVYAFGPK